MSAPAIEMESMQSLVQTIQFLRQGVPAQLIQTFLQEAAEELATAHIGQVEIDIQGDHHVDTYDFSHCIPDGVEVMSVGFVRVCGECVYPIDKCDPCPRGFEMLSDTCLKMYPCPPNDTFSICLSLRPSEACNALPKCFAKHRNFLRNYVNGQLAMMQGEEWSSERTARMYIRKADGLKKALAAQVSRGYSHTPVTVSHSII